MKYFFSFFLLLSLFSAPLFSEALTPEQRKELFASATQRLKETGIENKILKKGQKFPDIVLDGKLLSVHLEKSPAIFTVYRGGWCPYCVKQLKDLNAFHQQSAQNLKIFAISPEVEVELRKTKDKNELDITLISDIDHKILRGLNLVFTVEQKVVNEYKTFGIDLEKSQGNAKNELPVPATFVIGKNNEIIYAFADADYTKRAELSEIKKALSVAQKSYQ